MTNDDIKNATQCDHVWMTGQNEKLGTVSVCSHCEMVHLGEPPKAENTALSMTRLSPEMENILSYALRYCDERGLDDEKDLQQALAGMADKAFRNAIAPYIKVQVDLLTLGTGSYRLHADGTVEHIPQPLSPEMQKTFDLADEMIEFQRKRYSLAKE